MIAARETPPVRMQLRRRQRDPATPAETSPPPDNAGPAMHPTQQHTADLSDEPDRADATGLRWLPAAGAAARAALLAWSVWQDATMEVKYTDIDYQVVTDGARHVAAGGSPFDRATYRYTPLLAWLMLPNIWLHPAAGKLLFCAADLVAAWQIDKLLRLQDVDSAVRRAAVGFWLFNPFTATISSRGSGEALVTVMLLHMLLCLFKGRHAQAGATFGLVVHWRIYPVIYALPVLLFLPARGAGPGDEPPVEDSEKRSQPGVVRASLLFLRTLVSKQRVIFSVAAGSMLVSLTLGCYALYGRQFLDEAYFYHATRQDPRHNFSPHFYPIYLRLSHPDPGPDWLGRFSGICQLTTVAALGARFATHLPFAMLTQTLAFVMLNKVVTAQYFVWYFSLAPLALPFFAPDSRKGLCLALTGWAVAQLHWLGWAYLLEFRGRPAFLGVWAASIAFLAANAALLMQLLRSFRAPVSFRAQSRSYLQRILAR